MKIISNIATTLIIAGAFIFWAKFDGKANPSSWTHFFTDKNWLIYTVFISAAVLRIIYVVGTRNKR